MVWWNVLKVYLNHAEIYSWNHPDLCNEGKVFCSRKQRKHLIVFKLTYDRHPLITSRKCLPLCHANVQPFVILNRSYSNIEETKYFISTLLSLTGARSWCRRDCVQRLLSVIQTVHFTTDQKATSGTSRPCRFTIH